MARGAGAPCNDPQGTGRSIGRRTFLGGLGAAGVVAVTGVGGCSGSSSNDRSGPSTTRGTSDRTSALRRPEGKGPWVVVLGGGVGGMSAAHELRERGLPVTVLEKRSIPGGKARSMPVPDSATGDRRDLPGEHGFRFFPGFYEHLPDTMKRIPYDSNRNGVYDNLVVAPATTMARSGRPDITVPLAKLDVTLANANEVFASVFRSVFGLADDEAAYFSSQMAVFLTSCDARRVAEFEQQDWWSFVGADRFSEDYRRLLVVGATRNTVAARAEQASVRTIGLVMARFLNQLITDNKLDRLLDGPTNDVWIQPWLDHLRAKGVDYHLDATVQEIRVGAGGIEGVIVDRGNGAERIEADEYVLATPIEVTQRLVPARLAARAPELANLRHLKTEWMNGIQYHLRERAPIVAGHVNYVDSPWALTSISQQQFWDRFDLATDFGDGTVHDIVSIDISNWDAPGIVHRKPATACTADEIAEEVWAQMKAHLDDSAALPDDLPQSWFLDPAIRFPRPGHAANDEPLLVNTVGSWANRPDARTTVPNLFLASDYVRTTTDLATMEGANEAARRAVNAILAKHRLDEEPCELFVIEEPSFLASLRQTDETRFDRGEPNILQPRRAS